MWGSGNYWRNYSELLEVMSRGVCYGGEQLVPKGRGGGLLASGQGSLMVGVPKGRGGLLILRSVVEANL